jgi:hypothetical protein
MDEHTVHVRHPAFDRLGFGHDREPRGTMGPASALSVMTDLGSDST